LAHVLTSKYADHLPLYRQSEIYARQGVDLERSTLADWVGGTSQLLTPLVNALRHYVISASKLHADDTLVPVLAPGNGKTKTGRLWTYVRDDRPAGDTAAPAVWFAYSPDRKGEHPARHLHEFSGALQADAYAGFNQLYEDGRIQEVACWVHVRRKFYDLQQAHASPVANDALQRIAALYGIEKEIRGRRITKKLAGTYSNISDTSSPSLRNTPPQPLAERAPRHCCRSPNDHHRSSASALPRVRAHSESPPSCPTCERASKASSRTIGAETQAVAWLVGCELLGAHRATENRTRERREGFPVDFFRQDRSENILARLMRSNDPPLCFDGACLLVV
jgi:hypothetical protein